MHSDRHALANVLRSIARLMAEPDPSPTFRLLLLIARMTTTAGALGQLADSTMATMPLARMMQPDSDEIEMGGRA